MADFDLKAQVILDTKKALKEVEKLKKDLQAKLKTQLGDTFGLKGVFGAKGKDGKDALGPVEKLLSNIFKTNNKNLLALGKIGLAIGAVALGVGVLAKASPRLQAAISRMAKTFLLFLKPAGDWLANVLNPITKWLRERMKAKARGDVEEPEFPVIGEDFGENLRRQVEENIRKGIGGIKLGDFPAFEFPDIASIFGEMIENTKTGFRTLYTWIEDNYLIPLRERAKETNNGLLADLIDLFIDPSKNEWKDYKNFVKKVFNTTKTFIEDTFLKPLGLDFETLKATIKTVWESVKTTTKSIWTGIKSTVMGVINSIKNAMAGIGGIPGQIVGSFVGGGGAPPGIPARQVGGLVPNDGLFFLHRGEKVLRSGEGGGNTIVISPQISLSATVASDIDIDEMARKVVDKVDGLLVEKLRRLT